MPPALAAQKADYLFGGATIVVAFALQLLSFFVSPAALIEESTARFVPYCAVGITIVCFLVLRYAAASLAKHYERQIVDWLSQESSQSK